VLKLDKLSPSQDRKFHAIHPTTFHRLRFRWMVKRDLDTHLFSGETGPLMRE
jgi:hypothetical protein